MLRDNTNLYASMRPSRDPHWYSITVSELKIIFAITIYMGIYHFPTIYDYWRTDGIAPVTSNVVEKMTRVRVLFCLHSRRMDNTFMERK